MVNYIKLIEEIGALAEKVAPETTATLGEQAARLLSETKIGKATERLAKTLIEDTTANSSPASLVFRRTNVLKTEVASGNSPVKGAFSTPNEINARAFKPVNQEVFVGTAADVRASSSDFNYAKVQKTKAEFESNPGKERFKFKGEPESHGFKVLLDGKSPYDSTGRPYPLPSLGADGKWIPGAWIEHKPVPAVEEVVADRIKATASRLHPRDPEAAGLYIDSTPHEWVELFAHQFKSQTPKVFEVEIGDAESLYQWKNIEQFPRRLNDLSQGFTAQRIRLLRPVESGQMSASHILAEYEPLDAKFQAEIEQAKRDRMSGSQTDARSQDVYIPKGDELDKLPLSELATIAEKNHQIMLERVEKLGDKLPLVAFRGVEKADATSMDNFLNNGANDGRKRHFALPSEITPTAEEKLTDMASAMRYSSSYSGTNGLGFDAKLFIFDASKEDLLDHRIKYKPSGLLKPFKEQSKNTGEIVRPLGTMDYIGALDSKDLHYHQPPTNLVDYFERCRAIEPFINQGRLQKVLTLVERYVSFK